MKKRIGNIEIRKLEDEYYSHEVVYWYPNKYYGQESNYKKIGDFYETSDWRIHKSCFENPEMCLVVAFITQAGEGEIPNLETVGGRLFELNEEDLISFEKLMREFYKTYKSCSENFGTE